MAEASERKSLYTLGTEYESAAETVASRIKTRRDRLKTLSPHCKEAVSLRADISALSAPRSARMSVLSLIRRSAAVLAASLALSGAALAQTGPLVSTEWLEKNLSDPKLRIVEVSVEPGIYERGHIPGAQNIAWHTDLVETVSRDIAGPEKFQALARKLGVDKDVTVVLYGDNNNWFAAWGAWVFDIYGLRDNVKLLDGGRKKWELEKRPVATNPVPVKASSFTVGEPNNALRARLTDVVASVEKKSDARILDIRSPDEFSGKIIAPAGFQELALRAGHSGVKLSAADNGCILRFAVL